MKKMALTALLLLPLLIVACGESKPQPRTPTATPERSIPYAEIGEDHHFPVENEACWEWYPTGYGIAWVPSPSSPGIPFIFTEMTAGKARINQFSEVKEKDVIFITDPEGTFPFFKIMKIDPTQGVQVALIREASEDCRPGIYGTGAQRAPSKP